MTAADALCPLDAVNDEIMPLRLATDGLTDGLHQHLVPLAGTQRRTKVGRVLLSQAHEESTGASQPHPVAAFAEIMGKRGDEADPPASLPASHIARRTSGPMRTF